VKSDSSKPDAALAAALAGRDGSAAHITAEHDTAVA